MLACSQAIPTSGIWLLSNKRPVTVRGRPKIFVLSNAETVQFLGIWCVCFVGITQAQVRQRTGHILFTNPGKAIRVSALFFPTHFQQKLVRQHLILCVLTYASVCTCGLHA